MDTKLKQNEKRKLFNIYFELITKNHLNNFLRIFGLISRNFHLIVQQFVYVPVATFFIEITQPLFQTSLPEP